jgi:hypothetical protein
VGPDGYPRLKDIATEWPILGFAAPYNEVGRSRLEALQPRLLEYESKSKTSIFGFPIMMNGPSPLQFVITPKETVILNYHREIRHIHTDGRAHPAADDLWITAWGDSVGRWEGETLVIDTVAVRQPGPFNVPLPILSEAARYSEKLRRVDDNHITNEITIEDPELLSGPWVIEVRYKRAEHLDRMFHDQYENDRSSVSGDYFTIDPPASSPTAP